MPWPIQTFPTHTPVVRAVPAGIRLLPVLKAGRRIVLISGKITKPATVGVLPDGNLDLRAAW